MIARFNDLIMVEIDRSAFLRWSLGVSRSDFLGRENNVPFKQALNREFADTGKRSS